MRLQEGLEQVRGFIEEPFDIKVEIIEIAVRYMAHEKQNVKIIKYLGIVVEKLQTIFYDYSL
ncbi:MAG: hypothetical protein PHE02_03255 [Lachnospiraceae bacterium]|nr:hypothetical protein [Lachnospiraceae bacterium]